MSDPFKSTIFENKFWLHVMQDHTVFTMNALTPVEKEIYVKARNFYQAFEKMRYQIEDLQATNLGAAQLVALNRDSMSLTTAFRDFQRELLNELITCRIRLNLSPTDLSHMIREANEFIRVLHKLLNNKSLDCQDVFHLHLLWLPDASGHAAFLRSGLDLSEAELFKITSEFKNTFDHLILKCMELDKMLPYPATEYPVVKRLNIIVTKHMQNFQKFLTNLQKLEHKCMLLTTYSSLVPDHMARETEYYLLKLSLVKTVV